MKIAIEFYASLMKYLPPGNSRFKREVKVDEGLPLQKLIDQYHISKEEAHIVLVNGHFVSLEDRPEYHLKENDVVSVWPPVAGG
jgi:thiamine biosynthesis protein ThiS